MTTDTIGLDLGDAIDAAALAGAAREAGARVARVHIRLGDRPAPDEAFLGDLSASLQSLVDSGMEVVAAVDSDLTVAPSGLGAFDDPPSGPLAGAWDDEWRANVQRVAGAVGGLVATWEVLPGPNRGTPPRIAPGRWAKLVEQAAAAIRNGSAGSRIISGGVVSGEASDGSAYLAQALDAFGGRPVVDAVAVMLEVLPDGGTSEEAVIGRVEEHAERLTAQLGASGLAEGGIAVTALGWDAGRTGEAAQARNLWAAMNALSNRPLVHMVVWRGLVDASDSQSGLHRGHTAAPDDRRTAWQAFNDLAVYLRQIAPPAGLSILASLEEPPPLEPWRRPESAAPLARPEVAEPAMRTVRFRVPALADLLRAEGVSGPRLDSALTTLEERYGTTDLPPGEYEVQIVAEGDLRPLGTYTNQDVISAFYRVGEGTWTLFERSGLTLSELATNRTNPYSGTPVEDMAALTDEEREAVQRELEGTGSGATG